MKKILRFASLVCLAAASAFAQPRLLDNINETNGAGSDPSFYRAGETAVMVARGDDGVNLWRTDGSEGGTQLLSPQLYPYDGDSLSARRVHATSVGETIWIAHPLREGVWQTDGTAADTSRIADLQVRRLHVHEPTGQVFLVVEPEDESYEGGEPTLWAADLRGERFDLLGESLARNGRDVEHEMVSAQHGVVILSTAPFLSVPRGTVTVSDGTPAGTVRVAEGPMLSGLVAGAGLAFFTRFSSPGGETWITDGTLNGTRRLFEESPGAGAPSLRGKPFVVGDQLLFFGTGTDGPGLFRLHPDLRTVSVLSTGTLQLGPPRNSFGPFPFVSRDGVGYFAGDDGVSGLELWTTDGTREGTRQVHDICPGACSSDPVITGPGGVARLGASLVVLADDGVSQHEPWILQPDGTATLLGDLCPAACDTGDETRMGVIGPRLLLATATEGLWASDGSPAGTERLFPDATAWPDRGVEIDDALVFEMDDRAGAGAEPWRSDGTLTETRRLVDAFRGDAGSHPKFLTPAAGQVFFVADDGIHGQEIWRTDGTEPGTRMVADLAPGAADASLYFNTGSDVLRAVEGGVYFFLSDPTGTTSLFFLDADGELSAPLTSFEPGIEPQITAEGSVALSSRMVFSQANASGSEDLWVSDRTPETTGRLSGAIDVAPPVLSVGEQALFVNRRPDGDFELRSTDGEIRETTLLPIPSVARRNDLLILPFLFEGSAIVERLDSDRIELWLTDGRIAGTDLLATVPGASSGPRTVGATRSHIFLRGDASAPGLIRVDRTGQVASLLDSDWLEFFSDGRIYSRGDRFFFSEEPFGEMPCLWVTDGTPEGTRLARCIEALDVWRSDRQAAMIDGRLIFSQRSGFSVWTSDGSTAGTFEIMAEGAPVSFLPSTLEETVLLLRPDTGNRQTFWRTDGTREGTFFVSPVGLLNGNILPVVGVGDQVIFGARHHIYGSEVWTIPRVNTEAPPVTLRTDDRFEVRVRWRLPDGTNSFGTPERLTSDTGVFWFFRQSNLELMVKILDGRNNNGHFWVFYGALSNLEYTITVTDRESGRMRVYENPPGTFASAGDTQAFPATVAAPIHGAGPTWIDDTVVDDRLPLADALTAMAGTVGGPGAEAMEWAAPDNVGCSTVGEILCLQQSRFEVSVEWEKPDGERGSGTAVSLTQDTGYFWFFRDTNVEVMVKILDGRGSNGHFWVFYGALSNLRYTLTVTDTETGAVRTYENPPGEFASVGDTRAFPAPQPLMVPQ